MHPLKTSREVARELGVSYWRLANLLRSDKLPFPPQKNASGDYVWRSQDIENARKALVIDRRRKAVRS